MKKTSFITIVLTALFCAAIVFLDSCKSSDVPPANIDPDSQPTELTEALQLTGKIKKGPMPTGKPDATFRIEKAQSSASVTNDNSLFVPFVYAIKPSQSLKGFYLQIKGSDVYWDIPYVAKPARIGATNENPEKNGFVIDIRIPKHILNGKFELLYQLYDNKGNVSEATSMKGELVSSVDYCANGGMTLGRVSGQDGITVRSYELGDKPGWVTIKYNTYIVKDRIDIRYAGEWIRSTGSLLAQNQTPPIGQCNNVTAAQGFVGQASEFNIYYDPQKGKRIDIYVSGCLDGGTQWVFEITDCPSERVILGIHSSEPVNNCFYDCNNFGHAWVSLTESGKSTYYGLWPDNHDEIQKRGMSNGNGTDIRTNVENGMGEVNRFYVLNKDQLNRFNQYLRQTLVYNGTKLNCAVFASNIVTYTVNENINNNWLLGIPAPCTLSRSIEQLNRTNPTEVNYSPIGIKISPFNRSFCSGFW